ncbi:MAG: RHS repeat-associated core domain-containing protein, partial [Ktedonobacteraceae bacterium]
MQVYSPYGTPRYKQVTITTDKGFTGQYLDASGLNYDHARYYDAVVGRFVSADTAQGNGQGMDPYSYVGNNPETLNDPTGRMYADHSGDIARPLPHAAWVNSAGCGKVPNCSVR